MAYKNHSTELGDIYQTVGPSTDKHVYTDSRVNLRDTSHNSPGKTSRWRRVLLFIAAALIFVSVVISCLSLYRVETREFGLPAENVSGTQEQKVLEAATTTEPDPTNTDPHPTTAETLYTTWQLPSCGSGYILNPFSNTCFGGTGGPGRNWTEAKMYCEDKGEFLATPHSFESASWLQQMSKNGAFVRNNFWLGGRLIGDQWQWVGRVTGPILYSFWSESEPNGQGGETCLDASYDFTWNDLSCNKTYHHALCEKVV